MNFYKKIYPVIIAITGIVLISSCTEENGVTDFREQEQRFFDLYVGANYPDVQPQSNGLYYIEHKAGSGSTPGPEDWVLVNHVCYTIPEDIIYESYVENVARDNQFYSEYALYGPYKMKNGSTTEGLQNGLQLMKEGAQATIFFTSDLGYGSKTSGDVSAYTSLKYEIELLEVIGDIDSYEEARINSYMDTILVSEDIQDPVTEAIMYCIIDEANEGDPIANDSVVQIVYKGYLMDGRVFDQNTSDDPLEVTVGEGSVIEGWELGLLKLHEGEKARFVIPYQLAYGEAGEFTDGGYRVVPPYETLLFDIEVISVEAGSGDSSDPD